MFDADRPITTNEQDRLGRTVFAKSLARCIFDQDNSQSIVIGLYGGWGVGKTSVINLTLEELRFAASNMSDDEMPIILNFSPWSYSGQNQLIFHFFRRLSSMLRQAPFLENAEKIIYLLELYISFFTNKPVPKSLRPSHNIFTKLFRRHVMRDETVGWESGRDPVQVKAELNELLSQQKHKIIIIIDNIARLNNPEIQQVFQIVKSMGDYANTVYLLAMDKQRVVQALDALQGFSGEEYLNKIVQLPFEIPPISQQNLESIFVERLNHVLKLVPPDTWNRDYWADLYYSGLKNFFDNIRDISRYVNTLSFSYIHVREVVNPVDFFAITALEVIAPAVYNGIQDNKDLFTDLMDDVFRLDDLKIREDRIRCDEILNRAPHIPNEILLQTLLRLFPRLRSLYETDIPFYHSEAIARQNRRICSPDMFDIYFRLAMPSGVMPESEFHAIMDLVGDEEGFDLALLRLNQDEKMISFLDWLDSMEIKQIPTPYISHVIDALIDSADLFPGGESSPISFNTPMRVHRIIHQLMSRFESNEKRFELLADAITKALNSLYIIVHELTVQGQEHVETEDTFLPLEHRDFSPEQLLDLQKLAVEKIIYWAETERLVNHPKLLAILFAWQAWEKDHACIHYVARITKEEKGLVAFLEAALQIPIDETIHKLERKNEWSHYLINIDKFIAPQLLEPLAKQIFEDVAFEKLSEREQLAILIFLDLIHAETVKIIPRT
jgi:predicted KAP-like P-loop ATPase